MTCMWYEDCTDDEREQCADCDYYTPLDDFEEAELEYAEDLRMRQEEYMKEVDNEPYRSYFHPKY